MMIGVTIIGSDHGKNYLFSNRLAKITTIPQSCLLDNQAKFDILPYMSTNLKKKVHRTFLVQTLCTGHITYT